MSATPTAPLQPTSVDIGVDMPSRGSSTSNTPREGTYDTLREGMYLYISYAPVEGHLPLYSTPREGMYSQQGISYLPLYLYTPAGSNLPLDGTPREGTHNILQYVVRGACSPNI